MNASENEGLWAPWRVEYFSAPRRPDFLLEAGRSDEDRPHLVLVRRKHCFLMMNRYPYAVGHLMAVPYRKVGELADLSEGERLELWELAIQAQALLKRTVGADGFNVGLNLGQSAGAGVLDHVHLHIVPRRIGDHNFMPVIGGTPVFSESLWGLYDRLRQLCEGGGSEHASVG